MRIFSPTLTAAVLSYPELIQSISAVFASGAVAPQRHHHTINKITEPNSTLLLMPAWADGFGVGGVKIVNVMPGNSQRGLPSIMASYLVFDEITGEHIALLDGATLTAKRTAAVSALGADKLAHKDASVLLIAGAGRVAKELAHAFSAVRDIKKILIWNRTKQHAHELAEEFNNQGFNASSATDLQYAVSQADIISCATLSSEPIIHGNWLKSGQHLDLIGSYAPHMREADDEAIGRSKVFIDTEAALHETGDLIEPLKNGTLSGEKVLGTLYDMCKNDFVFHRNYADITLFKGVGHALEDLAAAKLALSSQCLTVVT